MLSPDKSEDPLLQGPLTREFEGNGAQNHGSKKRFAATIFLVRARRRHQGFRGLRISTRAFGTYGLTLDGPRDWSEHLGVGGSFPE